MNQSKKGSIKQLELQLSRVKSTKEKIELLNSLGVAIELQDAGRAETLYKEALNLSQNIQDYQNTAISAKHLCVFYSQILSDNTKALEYAEIALPIYQQLNNLYGESRLLYAIGNIHMTHGDSELAEKFFKESIRQASIIGDRIVECNSSFYLGTMLKNLARYEEALEFFKQANSLLDKNDKHKESLILNNIGIIKYQTGDYAQAMYYYTKSLEIKESLGNLRGVANTLNNMANIYTDFCDYDNALTSYKQSLQIKYNIKDISGIANTLLNIGTIFQEMKIHKEALKFYRDALEIYYDLQYKFKISVAMACIGDVLVEEGNIEEGLEMLKNSYNSSKEIKDTHNLATACMNISKALSKNNFAESISFANEGLNYCLAIGDKLQLPKHFLNLSTIYLGYNYVKESLVYSNKAIELTSEQGDKRNLFAALQSAAYAHEKIGNYSEALALYKQYTKVKEEVLNENSIHKVNTFLVQFNNERMQHDNEIRRLKAEEAEKQAEFYNRELQLIALHLVEKNELLKQVKSLIQKNISGSTNDLSKLVTSIESNVAAKEEWQTFKQKFDRAHDEFIQRLSKGFPQLTPMELKVAALLRIHMENKDIANLLYTSVRTVEGHRLNIRKKLGLGLKDNLSVFLAGW